MTQRSVPPSTTPSEFSSIRSNVTEATKYRDNYQESGIATRVLASILRARLYCATPRMNERNTFGRVCIAVILVILDGA